MDPLVLATLKFILFGLLIGVTQTLRVSTFDDLYEFALGDEDKVPMQKLVALILIILFAVHLYGTDLSEYNGSIVIVFILAVLSGEIISDKLPDFMGTEKTDEFYSYRQFKQTHRRPEPDWDYSPFWQAKDEQNVPPNPRRHRASTEPSPLDILKLKPGASLKQAKAHYRKLARKYHPDVITAKGGTAAQIEKAQRKMQDINRAYDWCEENL